jgi:predicted O-methyltransferase YrrM
MPYAVKFYDRKELLEFALTKVSMPGIFAEFGVFQGESINFIAEKLNDGTTVFGFDSFEGLKEDWRGAYLTKGAFSLGGQLPRVRGNVELITGWFDATVPQFLGKHQGPFAFIHVDCDTYEATQTLFSTVEESVLSGTVIVFGEYFGFTGWRVGESKAWQEFVTRRGIRYEYIGFANVRVAVRVL